MRDERELETAFAPHRDPHVEQRDEDTWFCRMYSATFDREAYEIEGECPICADMRRAQQGTRGAL